MSQQQQSDPDQQQQQQQQCQQQMQQQTLLEEESATASQSGANQPHTPNAAERLISQKHDEYDVRCNRYRALYYSTRLMAGGSAALLPFFVQTSPSVATTLSIVTLICIVVDQTFNPKEKWALYSKATDLLMIASLKASGQYERSKELLDILQEVEAQSVSQLSGLSELLDRLKKAR